MEEHRLFVALPIPETLQDEVGRWREGHDRLPVRWLTGKNLHVTLVSPWYGEVEAARAFLEQASGRAFDISFRRVVYGPDPRAPRLIWAEGQTPALLLDLKRSVEEALGRAPERRPFRLHLTLARFRPEMFAQFPERSLDESVAWSAPVRSFVLMESHLAPGGADYEVLEKYPLG